MTSVAPVCASVHVCVCKSVGVSVQNSHACNSYKTGGLFVQPICIILKSNHSSLSQTVVPPYPWQAGQRDAQHSQVPR